ncbi:MAG: DNA-directed RNA polymerase subunit alpha [Candidatus Aminicenantia bacterium]
MFEINFQRPRRLECDYDKSTDTYGIFYAYPLERGFGTSIGNVLRRTLLSSIPGAAITAVRIEGVYHEFSSIPGVYEDVMDIILNLKKVPLILHSEEPGNFKVKLTGPGEFKSGDLSFPSELEVVDKSIYIVTLEEGAKLEMELRVKNGIGYVTADKNFDPDLPLGFIPVDSVHSPITKVNFDVELMRLGGRGDYEKLILEIWTNGTIKPQEALSIASKIVREHLTVFLSVPDRIEVKEEVKIEEIPYLEQLEILSKSVEELDDLQQRTINAMKTAGFKWVYELVERNHDDLVKNKVFGQKALNEIKEVLERNNLSFGLILHPKLKEMIQRKIEEEKDEGEEDETQD